MKDISLDRVGSTLNHPGLQLTFLRGRHLSSLFGYVLYILGSRQMMTPQIIDIHTWDKG